MRASFQIEAAKFVALATVSLFIASVSAKAFSGSFDGGGRVLDYLDQVSAANAGGYKVEIAGVCASACTMKLGARNACVYRNAELLFHAAHDDNGRVNDLGTRILLRQYPGAIRSWVLRHNAAASNDVTVMTGTQAISLGVQDCEHLGYVAAHSFHRNHSKGANRHVGRKSRMRSYNDITMNKSSEHSPGAQSLRLTRDM